jgi:hypothetical protein
LFIYADETRQEQVRFLPDGKFIAFFFIVIPLDHCIVISPQWELCPDRGEGSVDETVRKKTKKAF